MARRNGLLRSIALLGVAILLVTEGVAQEVSPSEVTSIRVLQQQVQKRDQAGQQGSLVTLAGRVLGVADDPIRDRRDIYLQDATAGIRVTTSKSGEQVSVQDSILAVGVAVKENGEVFLVATTYKVQAKARHLIQRAAVPFLRSPWVSYGAALLFASLVWAFYLYRARLMKTRERQARMMFEQNAEPIVKTDLDGRVIEANEVACALFGFSHDQIRLHTLMGLLGPDTVLDLNEAKGIFEEGNPYYFEVQIEPEEGAPIDLEGVTRKLDDDGHTLLFTVFHDITKRKNDERLFKGFHKQLVEHLPLEVAVLAPQGQYIYINPMAVADAEARRALLGKTDIEYCQHMGWHPEIALRRRSHRRQAMSAKDKVSFEETLPSVEGEVRFMTRIYNPVLDRNGEVTAVIAYGIDTTDLKDYQDQMQDIQEEAERIAKMKKSFLATVSHEFRTPLTGILGFAQILQDEIPDKNREFVDIILRNGRRLMATLNAMMDLSRLETNYLDMSPQVFNMVDEVKEVAQSVAELAREKELYLRMRTTRPEYLVRLDRAYLYRVLENLIGNAVKFTHKGGVLIEVHGDAEHVHVKVMDSGVGIRNEFLPFLFEEFNQESSGTTRDFEGVGIGLSVTKRLLDLMGGAMTVDSEKGEGSMFTLTFPSAFPQAVNGLSTRSSVLVADDNKEVHTLIEYVLSPYFDVEYAKDFASAVKRATETKFDVVLLDAELGDATSATDMLTPLKGLRGYESVPVLALDPHAARGGEVQYQAAGYDGYLTKPISKKVLLDSIGDVLAGNGASGESSKRSTPGRDLT